MVVLCCACGCGVVCGVVLWCGFIVLLCVFRLVCVVCDAMFVVWLVCACVRLCVECVCVRL